MLNGNRIRLATMKIRYISIHMNDSQGWRGRIASTFNRENRFISDYLSRNARLLNLSVGGSLDSISVVPARVKFHRCRLGDNELRIEVPFTINYYNYVEGASRCKYVMELLQGGYLSCFEFNYLSKEQFQSLLDLNMELEQKDFTNEWIHRCNGFGAYGIEAALYCSLTSQTFQLELVVKSLTGHRELFRGIVTTAPPDSVNVDRMFNDVVLEDNKLIITDDRHRPVFILDMQMVLKGQFSQVMA